MSFSEWTPFATGAQPYIIKMRPTTNGAPVLTVKSGYSSLHFTGGPDPAHIVRGSGGLSGLNSGRARAWYQADDVDSILDGFELQCTDLVGTASYFVGFQNDDVLAVRKSSLLNIGAVANSDEGPHGMTIVANTWYAIEVTWQKLGGPNRMRIRAWAGPDFDNLTEAFDFTDSSSPLLSSAGLGHVAFGGAAENKYFDRLEVYTT